MKIDEIKLERQRIEKAEALAKELESLKYIKDSLWLGLGKSVEIVASDRLFTGGKEYLTEHRVDIPFVDDIHKSENAEHIRKLLYTFVEELYYKTKDELDAL